MVAAIFLSRVLGLVRDGVISHQFGIAAYRDAYVAAFAIPDLLFFLIAGGALSSAFIPVFTRYWTKGEEDEAWKVFSTLATFMGLVVLAFVLIAGVFAEPLMAAVRPGLDPEVRKLSAELSRILLPSQFGFFLGGLMFGTMNARKHFLTPALSPNIYNIGIILGASVLAPLFAVKVFGLAWGALAGALVGNLVIPIWVMRRFGGKFSLRLDLKHEGVRQVFKLMIPVIFGLSLPGVYALVVGGFGSYFGEGAISALDIGNRIMQAPLGIFGQSLAIAVFPTLVALHVEGKKEAFLSTVSKTLRTTVYIGLFVSAVMFVLSEDIIRVLNQYGKFSASDTVFVAQSLRFFSLGVFAWCAHPVVMRAFFAMEDTLTPTLLGTVTTAVFVGLCFVFTHGSLGYAGLALAVSLSAVFLLAILLIGLKRKVGSIEGARLLRMLMLGGAAAVGAAFLVKLGADLFPNPPGLRSNLMSVLRIFLLGLGGAWMYLGIGKLFGLEEARYALAGINKRFRRSEEPPNTNQ